ncbi:MAG: acyl-CoA synthetase FdrA [Elusimicrobia bacterium]|nr:acyl-CoA synthetase FdrA [Elusimicrobiota bacterium]
MFIKSIVKKGVYHDSVSLMKTARELNSVKGVGDCAIVMATKENKGIVKASGLYNPELDKAGDNDLVITVKARDEESAADALKKAEELLKPVTGAKGGTAPGAKAKGIENAVQMLGGADLAIVSVAGRFAGKVAMDCLQNGLHVMLFSDNVSLETEIELKKTAFKKNLLMMGPDCGTAIINGAPLAFANSVGRGNIGIVAAAGTGLQEVSSLISNEGGGISQAIGAGSRDVKKEVGAVTFIQGLKALDEDKATSLIILISKPPHPQVLKKILAEVKKVKKPVVAVFLGGDVKLPSKKDFYPADTLEEAALKAVYLAKGDPRKVRERLFDINREAASAAEAEAKNKRAGQKYLKGLFSGGTFVSEVQLVLKEMIGPLWSNAPLDMKYKLPDSLKLKGNCVIDMGEDEFTVGRPHPMIDYSLRNKMMVSEAKRPETAVILLDVVLGYGSNPRPLDDILPAVNEAFKNNKTLSIAASVTGTETDPQVRSVVAAGLKKAGVMVMPSNASACRLAGEIVRRSGGGV